MAVTVHHPRLPDVSRVVQDAEVENWTAQGWVRDRAKPAPDAVVEPAPAPAVKPKRPRAPRRKK